MRYIKLLSPEKSYQKASLKKCVKAEDLPALCEKIHEEKKTIVTINGSFDLVHAGHLEILYRASKQGDVLFVLLNSDQSIKEYKDDKRPLIPLHYRMQMMAAFYFVDFVSSFEEINPIKILSLIKPDIHVNGSEYGFNCIEKDVVEKHGGKIHIVDLVPGLSTSQIVKKIINAYSCKI